MKSGGSSQSAAPLSIMSVVGARPNFMKIAPFIRAIEAHNATAEARQARPVRHRLVHTGQHYDDAMSRTFFDGLHIPDPDIHLGIGSGSHAVQVGKTMIAFEEAVLHEPPDWVVVVGDVNATCACAITAKKQHLRLAHIEAGLRSFDLDMPEEINRMVTDRLSDRLLTPDAMADANLRAEGVAEARICQVGNIMIDTLESERAQAQALDAHAIVTRHLLPDQSKTSALATLTHPLPGGRAAFGLMTLHRPSNVDLASTLGPLVDCLVQTLSRELSVVWSLHPRTTACLERFGLMDAVRRAPGLLLVSPLDYHEMLKLNMTAQLLVTDSGGLQEESCILGTPCITLRENTERPITLVENGGVSLLTGNDPIKILAAFHRLRDRPPRAARPPLWDGHTAPRILDAILTHESAV